jgi:ATP phosphoribosyltransferase
MKLAIPNKGRLLEPTISLLTFAGIKPQYGNERSLMIPTSWENILLVSVRTEDIPSIVAAGAAELGITGRDYVVESEVEVEEMLELDYGKAKIVFAAPPSIEEKVQKGEEIRVATKYYNIASYYLSKKGIKAKIVRISGAAEVMPSLGAADAIVDVTSTGTTLKIHGLKVLDTILESSAVLIANKQWRLSEESETIGLVITMIKGVLAAKGKKLLLMNVRDEDLEKVIRNVPSMKSPAITRQKEENLWEVITVVNEENLPEVIAKAKSSGASDILVVNIEKVIY